MNNCIDKNKIEEKIMIKIKREITENCTKFFKNLWHRVRTRQLSDEWFEDTDFFRFAYFNNV